VNLRAMARRCAATQTRSGDRSGGGRRDPAPGLRGSTRNATEVVLWHGDGLAVGLHGDTVLSMVAMGDGAVGEELGAAVTAHNLGIWWSGARRVQDARGAG